MSSLQTSRTWSVKHSMEKLDMFGQKIPSFNLKGKDTVYTMAGSLMSLAIMIVLLLFASIKFIHLSERYNPNVSQLLVKNFFSETDQLVLKDEDFRLAFTLEDYFKPEMKIDVRYVKIIVRSTGTKTGKDGKSVAINRKIPYRKCDEEDYDEFHPIEPGYVSLLDSLKKDPKRGMYCVDWKEANLNL